MSQNVNRKYYLLKIKSFFLKFPSMFIFTPSPGQMKLKALFSSCCGGESRVEAMSPAEGMARKKGESFLFAQEDVLRNRWDILIFCTVVFICIVVPLRLGFLIKEWQLWLPVDIASDLLLALDIVVCTMTTFEVDGEVIKDRNTILHHYLRGWFAADLLSVFPFEFIALVTKKYHPAYRANRLIRMGRLTYYFSQWEKVTSLKPSVIRIFKSTFVILFLAHFIGCAFFLVILIEGDTVCYLFIYFHLEKFYKRKKIILAAPFTSQGRSPFQKTNNRQKLTLLEQKTFSTAVWDRSTLEHSIGHL